MDYYNKKIDIDDINYTLEIDFFESIYGCQKQFIVKYNKICNICNGITKINSTFCDICKSDVNEDCEKCHGTGIIFLSDCPICKNGFIEVSDTLTLNIKKNSTEQTKYIIKNFNKGINGGKDGNLIINLKINNNTGFKILNKYDIQYTLNISFKDAILGKSVAIPTIHKKYYKLTIPKYTQSKEKIIINSLGLFNENENKYGNMIIKINIQIPTKLTNKQLELLKYF